MDGVGPQRPSTEGSESTSGNSLLPERRTEYITNIAADGDLLFEVECGLEHGKVVYRVGMEPLRSACRYFAALLDTSRYLEGRTIQEVHNEIRKNGMEPSQAPGELLPRVRIADVGPVTPASSARKVFSDLLRILHGLDVQIARPSLTYMANLGIAADRFDCLSQVAQHVKKTNILQMLSGKHPDRASILIPEERTRQRILVGWLLDQPEWLFNSSKRLVLGGSCLWRDVEVSEGYDRGLWWNLPDGLEAELCHRRECILATINSLQMHILSLYLSSKRRQCKLGYDSSPQCDSFQLGEMTRFFAKIGTLQLQGTIFADHADTFPPPYQGEIEQLIVALRQCPAYQVDKNHAHCGLRTRLIPALDQIKGYIQEDTGVCRHCWKDYRHTCRWQKGEPGISLCSRGARASNAKSTRPRAGFRITYCKNRKVHWPARDFFSAETRTWEEVT